MPNIAICENCDLFIRNGEGCSCTSTPIALAKFGAAFPPKGSVEEYSRRNVMPNCERFADQILARQGSRFKRNPAVCRTCSQFREQNDIGYRRRDLKDTPRFVCNAACPDYPIPLRIWHELDLPAACLYHERQYGEAQSREICDAIQELTANHPDFRKVSCQIGEKLSEWKFPQDSLSLAAVAANGLIGSKTISLEALIEAGGPGVAYTLHHLEPKEQTTGWGRTVYDLEKLFDETEGAKESIASFLACASRLIIPVDALLIQAAWVLLNPTEDKRNRLLPYISGFRWLLRKFEEPEQPDLAVQSEKYRTSVENCLRDLEAFCEE